ncbi:MAG: hypothetical protein QXL64_07110 [Thermofilaceae archaeon]
MTFIIPPEFLMRFSAAFATMYLVALGHSLFERSGVMNLAIDGVFFLSTGVSVLVAVTVQQVFAAYGLPQAAASLLATLSAGLVSTLIGVFMAWVLSNLPVSQAAVGFSLMFLGYGLGILAGYRVRLEVGNIRPYAYPYELAVYVAAAVASIAVGLLVYYILYKTSLGAMIRSCGENPHAATAMGVRVHRVRIFAGALGLFILGCGASFFPLLWQRYWDIKTYILGYGWFAFTIALASGRHPLLLIPFALVFGGLLEFAASLQALYGLQVDLAKMLPFAASIILFILYGSTKLRKALEPPASLGKAYYREERTV